MTWAGDIADVKVRLVNESSSSCLTMRLPIVIGPIGTARAGYFSGTPHQDTEPDSLIIQTHTGSCLLLLKLNGLRSPSSRDGLTSCKSSRVLPRLLCWLGARITRLGQSCR